MELRIKDVFLAGYLSNQAATYFNQVLLLDDLGNEDNLAIQEEFTKLSNAVQESGNIYSSNIKYATRLAQSHSIETLEMPKLPDSYFDWILHYNQQFSSHIEENIPLYAVYFFGVHLGNWTSSLYLLDNMTYLQLTFEEQLNYLGNIKEILLNIENTIAEFEEVSQTASVANEEPLFLEHWETLKASATHLTQLFEEELVESTRLEQLKQMNGQFLNNANAIVKELIDHLK